MSRSGELYLLLVIVATTGFALVLAYYSALQARRDRARTGAASQPATERSAHRVPEHA